MGSSRRKPPVYREDGKKICGAVRADKSICNATPVKGKDRCRKHGGLSVSGLEHPSFKTGKYTAALSGAYAERYAQARADEELLSLRDEIALTDARLHALVSRLHTGESDNLLSKLQSALDQMTIAMRAGDVAGMRVHLQALQHALAQGASEREIWDDIGIAAAQRMRLVESERKREVELKQMVSSKEITTLIIMIFEILTRHVLDQKIRGAIIGDIERDVLSSNARGLVEGQVISITE